MIDNDAPPPVRFTDHIKASLKRKLQVYLDRSVVWTKARWGGFAGLLVLYTIRVYLARGWYIVTYGLGIYVRIWLRCCHWRGIYGRGAFFKNAKSY